MLFYKLLLAFAFAFAFGGDIRLVVHRLSWFTFKRLQIDGYSISVFDVCDGCENMLLRKFILHTELKFYKKKKHKIGFTDTKSPIN